MIKKSKNSSYIFMEKDVNLIVNQINNGLMKEQNVIINLCKNGNNDILIYLIHNEGKSVIAKKFINKLKAKKMTVRNSKSYLSYLNKLVNQCNNIYHYSINEKPINADYSTLTEKMRLILKLLNLGIW